MKMKVIKINEMDLGILNYEQFEIPNVYVDGFAIYRKELFVVDEKNNLTTQANLEQVLRFREEFQSTVNQLDEHGIRVQGKAYSLTGGKYIDYSDERIMALVNAEVDVEKLDLDKILIAMDYYKYEEE